MTRGMTCLAALFEELASRRGLPRAEVLCLVEQSLARTLSRAMRRKVVVLAGDEGVEIFGGEGRDGAEGLLPIGPHLVRKELVRLFRHEVNLEFQRRMVILEHHDLRTLRGAVVRGVVDRVRQDGALLVRVGIEELFSCRDVIAVCPPASLPVRERGRLRAGDAAFFHVSSVSLLPVDGAWRHGVRLSRTTPRLTEGLLARYTGLGGIRCVRRIAGKISIVASAERLPNEAILSAGAELGERVVVRWGSCAGSSAAVKGRNPVPTWG